MNLAKSKLVLKKINNLYDSLELGDEISKIEKDLLLDYIKELYEMVIQIENKKDKKSKNPIELEKSFKKKEKKKNQIRTEEVEESIPSSPVKENIEVTFEEVLAESEPIIEKISSNGNGVHLKAEPIVNSAPSPIKKVSPELESLFDESIINQVDYRFSQTPITDITKAMGINERLLIINLLFNKDQQDFNYITSKLNYFNSFDEATQYLKSEVADKYDWANVEKREKAIEFIKLIKRKYA